MKRYFKVKYGYNPQDQTSIEETQLEKAIYAMINKTPVQLGNAFVNGSNIITITPHYHRHTGWADFYEPKDGDDFIQIKRDCPPYEGVVDYYRDRVKHLIETGQTNLIGKNAPILELPTPSFTHREERSGGVKGIGELIK